MKKPMIIKGHKDDKSLSIITCVSGVAFLVFSVFSSVKNGKTAPEFILAFGFILVSLISVLRYNTKYVVDEAGITRKKPFRREQSFMWNEFMFIAHYYQHTRLGAGVDNWIICSTHPKPLTDKGKDDIFYKWSESDTILIRWRGEEFYREFLSYCGGERDERY